MSSWETRELPLLRAIDKRLERAAAARRTTPARPRGASIAQLAADTGFSEEQVVQSLRILAEARGPYVTGEYLLQSNPDVTVTGLTDRARVELDKSDRDVHPAGPAQPLPG